MAIIEYGFEPNEPTLTAIAPDSGRTQEKLDKGIYKVVEDPKISGARCLQAYQAPPTKSDADRRASFAFTAEQVKAPEGYFSARFKFDASCLKNAISGQPDNWLPQVMKWQLRWGPKGEKLYRWWIGCNFRFYGNDRLGVTLTAGRLADGIWFNAAHRDVFGGNPRDNPQVWYAPHPLSWYVAKGKVQLQLYWKLDSQNGIVRAWFDDQLIMEKAGLNLDPRTYPEWNRNPITRGACAFWGAETPIPRVSAGMYGGTNSPEMWLWFDDLVVSKEKVPLDYRVGVPVPAEEPLPPPPPPPTSRTLVAQALPFPLILAKLWRLRTRFIREDIHRKVHPFI